MGLDWIVQAKQENGRTVEPGETAGERPATRSDPETVRQFREYYDDVIAAISDPGPRPRRHSDRTGLGFILDFLSGKAIKRLLGYTEVLDDWTREKEAFDHWNRPFEELLDEYIDGDPPIVPPENRDALAKIMGAIAGFYDFRGDVLREDQNDVSSYAADVLEMDYPLYIYGDLSPQEMLELGDDLEKALASYRTSDREQDEVSIEAVEAAIPWLRFWASKGHSIVADF